MFDRIWRKSPGKSIDVKYIGNTVDGQKVTKEGFVIIKYKGKSGQIKYRCVPEGQLSIKTNKNQQEVTPKKKYSSLAEYSKGISAFSNETAFVFSLDECKTNTFNFRMKTGETVVGVEVLRDSHNKPISGKLTIIDAENATKYREINLDGLPAAADYIFLKWIKDNFEQS